MRISCFGTPLRVDTAIDVTMPVVSPGKDVSVLVTLTSEDVGNIVLDIFLEREYSGTYLPVYSWPNTSLSLIQGINSYGGSNYLQYTLVNTGLWRWRIKWTDDIGAQEVYTYIEVQDVLRIPSTTMVKSSIGGCGTTLTGIPKLSVIQANDLSVEAFLYDNQGNQFIGLSSATDGEVRLISMETRLVSGTIPFSDLTFDDPELGDGSLLFDIPSTLTSTLAPGIYRVYLQVDWIDRSLEWPQLFDLNVLKQRI